MFRVLQLFLLLPFVIASPFIHQGHHNGRGTCTVYAQGQQKDDVPNILTAFFQCGQGGRIIFPQDQEYWIAQRLNPVINDVEIDWRGQWTVKHTLETTITPLLIF
jgi:galacturan 1,4-alpha-galacturonidase